MTDSNPYTPIIFPPKSNLFDKAINALLVGITIVITASTPDGSIYLRVEG